MQFNKLASAVDHHFRDSHLAAQEADHDDAAKLVQHQKILRDERFPVKLHQFGLQQRMSVQTVRHHADSSDKDGEAVANWALLDVFRGWMRRSCK